MKTEEYKLNLWKEFMQQSSEIREGDKEALGKIVASYVSDSSFLLQIYEAFVENDRFVEDEGRQIAYERDGDDYLFLLEGKEYVFSKEQFRKILLSMLDLLEDTIPLGSVVDLKKSAYQHMKDIDQIEHLRLVVTHRFLGKEEDSHYFPYGGVVYPTGMLGRKEILYFTRPLVESVVHEGYRDEKEDAYVYLMKKELVIEEGKHSFGYATKEEIDTFNQIIKKKEIANARG